MIIRKMTASFGALEGKSLTLREGLNVIYAPNESGKSTWCAFLRTMLYGLNTAERAKQGQQPDKKKYLPWSGTSISGSMDLQTPEGAVTLRRWTERAAQPMQAFSACVTDTDTPVPGLTADGAGQTLTGVPREVFERSAFIRQSGLAVTNAPELEKRLSALVSSGDEEESFSEADGRLRSWLRRRRSGRHGALPELEEEISRTEQALEDIQQVGQTARQLEEELARAQQAHKQAVEQMEKARSAQRRASLADMAESRSRLDRAQQARAEAAAAHEAALAALGGTPYGDMGPEEAHRRTEEDKGTVRELEHLAAKLPPVKIAFIPLAVAVLAILLAFLLPWRTALTVVGAVAALLFAVLYLRLLSLNKTRADTLADRDRILDAYGVSSTEEMDTLLEEYQTLWRAAQQTADTLGKADQALEKAREDRRKAESRMLTDVDFTNGDNEASAAGQAVRRAQARVDELRRQQALAEGKAQALGDPLVLRSCLDEKQQRRQALLAQEEALTLALDAMEQANRQLRERFSPKLAKTAAAFFSRLTDGRYDEITLARDLSAKARRTGDAVGREMDYLSQGAKDQLYLALRLAVCQLVLPEDKACPIVLDDALVSFDRSRMERALSLLKELAGERQILLFTCHRREGDFFADDPTVAKMALDG